MPKRKLQVKTSYNPNRLTEKIIAEAYEKVISQIKQTINSDKNNKLFLKSGIELKKTEVL